MRLVILVLLFLFCDGNICALERNEASDAILEKTQEMIGNINKILEDFRNSLIETEHVDNSEIKGSSNEISSKSSDEQGTSPGGSMNSLEQQKHHGESMQLFYKVQARYHDLQSRFTNLQKHGQEVKNLREQWANSKHDKGIYAQYTEEKLKYDEALKGYNKDLVEHEKMKKQHDEMKKMDMAR